MICGKGWMEMAFQQSAEWRLALGESTPESSGPPQNDFYMHWRKLMKTLQRRIHIETQNWDDGVAVANQKIGGSTHMEKK